MIACRRTRADTVHFIVHMPCVGRPFQQCSLFLLKIKIFHSNCWSSYACNKQQIKRLAERSIFNVLLHTSSLTQHKMSVLCVCVWEGGEEFCWLPLYGEPKQHTVLLWAAWINSKHAVTVVVCILKRSPDYWDRNWS